MRRDSNISVTRSLFKSMDCIADEDGRREKQEYKKWLFALTNDEDWGSPCYYSYVPGQEFQLPLKPLPYVFCGGSEASVILSLVVPYPCNHTCIFLIL